MFTKTEQVFIPMIQYYVVHVRQYQVNPRMSSSSLTRFLTVIASASGAKIKNGIIAIENN